MRISETASGLTVNGAQHAPGGAVSRSRPGTRGRIQAFRGTLGENETGTKASQKMRCAFIPIMTACKCCGREYLRRRRWQRACSRECQLVLLAAEKVVKAYREGRADGLCAVDHVLEFEPIYREEAKGRMAEGGKKHGKVSTNGADLPEKGQARDFMARDSGQGEHTAVDHVDIIQELAGVKR